MVINDILIDCINNVMRLLEFRLNFEFKVRHFFI